MAPSSPPECARRSARSLRSALARALDLELHFEKLASVIVKRPLLFIIASFLVTGVLASGWARQKVELRPEKQFVPRNAIALTHKVYVESVWSGELKIEAWIATPLEQNGSVLDASVVQELERIDARIKAIRVDGRQVALAKYPKLSRAQLDKVEGTWAYQQQSDDVRSKCYLFGERCQQSSLLSVFNDDSRVIGRLTDERVLTAANFWEEQSQRCLVSIARADSPCIDPPRWVPSAGKADCQQAESSQRANCFAALGQYCQTVCPDPSAAECEDGGCVTVSAFAALANAAAAANAANNASASSSAVAAGSDVRPFELDTVVSDATRDGAGQLVSAKVLRGVYFVASSLVDVGGESVDIVALEWEKLALCELGIAVDGLKASSCPPPEHVRITALFGRSFSDEFRLAINQDVLRFIVAVMGITLYMVLMISPCDPVHSMSSIAAFCVAITLMSYVSAIGLGSYAGIESGQLTNLVPFLLLGLGVDDAFVIIGEYYRATLASPSSSVEARCVAAMRHGGVSILITSATDALAFLIGSSSPLPSLQSFCLFSGIGILFCFTFQLTVLLPVLLLDARRAEQNRLEILCCIRASTQHKIEEPHGGCCLVAAVLPGRKYPSNSVQRMMHVYARWLVTTTGKTIALCVFAAVLALGVLGATRMYADFQLVWFVPEGSYVEEFFALNDQHFPSGTPFAVYSVTGDYHAQQAGLVSLSSYLNSTELVDHDAPIFNWWDAFHAHVAAAGSLELDKAGLAVSKDAFFPALLAFVYSAQGRDFSTSLRWVDRACESAATQASCQPGQGVRASRITLQTEQNATRTGLQRYYALQKLREEIGSRLPGAFPFSSLLIYWEETGVITAALVSNLIICGSVVVAIVFVLIREPRTALVVSLNVAMGVLEVIGYLHWWGVPISGMSTIFILISVGLIVDYSAHIGHVFVVSQGSPNERAIEALTRIGPSVFNAVVSTLVGVLALSTSKSLVFRLFFQTLCLTVVLGGAHGLVLLPVLLTLVSCSACVRSDTKPPTADRGAKSRTAREHDVEVAQSMGGSNRYRVGMVSVQAGAGNAMPAAKEPLGPARQWPSGYL